MITALYATLYRIGKTLPKRDHFGIHMKMENLSLAMLDGAINAQFAHTKEKLQFLEKIRINTEIEKHLARVAWNTHALPEKEYAAIAEMLVTISKMVNGWIRYVNGERENPS